MASQIKCPHCGKAYKWKPTIAGKRFRCRRCGEVLDVPDEKPTDQGDYQLATDKSPEEEEVLAPEGKCPNCGNKLRTTAVVCINCGFNLKDGKRIETRVEDDDIPKDNENQA